MRKLTELNPNDKKVVVRVDWNVALGKALEVVDDTRIRRTLPTVKWLIDNGAKQITLLAHLGKFGEGKSLRGVAEYAEGLLGERIAFLETVEKCQSDTVSQVKMLENLRVWEGEDKNDPKFTQQLADLGEVYIDEAFGEAHRESASIVGVAKLLPSYAGLNFAEEVETLNRVMSEPKRPLVVIMGGAKVEDKIKLLEVFSKKAETILLGGKLANEYLANGIKLKGDARVIAPVEGDNLLDIGEETRKIFAEEIKNAGTVIWNGPMGKVEELEYQEGTHAVYEALIANEAAYTVVGGGDTLAAIGEEAHMERIDFVSTGGGAMLKLLEKGTLPGIEVLK